MNLPVNFSSKLDRMKPLFVAVSPDLDLRRINYLCIFHVALQHRQHNASQMSKTKASHIKDGHFTIPATIWFIVIHVNQPNISHHEKHANSFGEIKLKEQKKTTTKNKKKTN